MRKTFVTLAALVTMTAMLPAGAAKAAVYSFSFTSFDGALTASGQMTVSGVNQVTAISGTISGLVVQTISGIVVDPTFPTTATTPDGSFTYDNLFHSSNPTFDADGLVFTTVQNTSGFWNLWGNAPGNYSLWESVGFGNYPVQETGNLTVARAPELSTWGMMGLGFAGLGLAGWRRAPRSTAMSLG